ncbi:MAG: PLP-dependent aminotransferase family protein [Oscillospiraceae bacterium]
MLTYNLSLKTSTPLYVRLYDFIKSDIEQNKLKACEKLPSKRGLAKHLNISIITVENSYNQLLSEGYIYSIEKKGYYVAKLENISTFVIRDLPVEPPKIENSDCFIDLRQNTIIAENFPFSVWAKLTRQVLSGKDEEILQRQDYQGTEKLRNAIANFLYHFRGMNVKKEQVIIGAGTEQLYGMLANIIGRNKLIAIEDPGYKKISQIYDYNNIKYLYIPMDNKGLSVQKLSESKAKIAHISPAHHFPTGITTQIGRRIELLNWAQQSDERFIIEDDYDSEFRFVGKPLPTMQSIDKNGKVIYVNTFSKSISPAIRISYMILPENLLRKSEEVLGYSSCAVSSLEQYTLSEFIANGHFERHINKMSRVYKIKKDMIINEINKNFANIDFEILEENSGLHFILSVNTKLTDEELIEAAKNKNIKIACLSQYYTDKSKCEPHMILINYTGIENEKIADGIKKLSEIIKCE